MTDGPDASGQQPYQPEQHRSYWQQQAVPPGYPAQAPTPNQAYPPAYPPPQYTGYGAYPYQQQDNNGIAVAALVLGIASVVIFWPAGIAAIICGAIGLGRANRGGQNKGLAIAGIITGAVGTLILVFFVVVVVATVQSN